MSSRGEAWHGPLLEYTPRVRSLEGVGGPAQAEAPAGGAGGGDRRRRGSSYVRRRVRSPLKGVAVRMAGRGAEGRWEEARQSTRLGYAPTGVPVGAEERRCRGEEALASPHE